MNTRIDRCLSSLKKADKKAFIAYITAGDPSLNSTVEKVLRLEDAGVDIIELGLPFSDPLADGRVNQESSIRALKEGASFNGVMNVINQIRSKSEIPIVLYAYINPLLSYGFKYSISQATQSGVDGFLLLDLPFEESGPYRKILKNNLVNTIQLITPTTPSSRIEKIVKHANGFVYCVSREGVTGVQDRISSGAAKLVENIKLKTSLPVAIGFGIGSPQQAKDAAKLADGVVVGSAIVNAFHKSKHNSNGIKEATKFVRTLVQAVKEI